MSVDECMRHPWLKAEETGKVNTDKLLALNNAEKAKVSCQYVVICCYLVKQVRLLPTDNV